MVPVPLPRNKAMWSGMCKNDFSVRSRSQPGCSWILQGSSREEMAVGDLNLSQEQPVFCLAFVLLRI